jgi:hypothetical protein
MGERESVSRKEKETSRIERTNFSVPIKTLSGSDFYFINSGGIKVTYFKKFEVTTEEKCLKPVRALYSHSYFSQFSFAFKSLR